MTQTSLLAQHHNKIHLAQKRAADVDDADATNTAFSNKRLRPPNSAPVLRLSLRTSSDYWRPSPLRFVSTRDFRSVGVAVEKILSSRLSKSTTVLHMDGLPLVEKESAHDKRDQKLSMQLETLERDYADGKLHNKRQLYKRLKASYRAPPEALSAVLEVLTQSGWRICQCLNQRDTCNAETVNNAAVSGDIRVITKDSDLMAFESITSITIPVKNTWTTFLKDELLEDHGLSTPAHLTLAALLSSNDYTNGVFHMA
ncbi:hypothetical protein BGX24_005075 [Mortierella sp. AD032]|nr:hypothetical protein BGX24_005075 [Mortierella sp. AD032]